MINLLLLVLSWTFTSHIGIHVRIYIEIKCSQNLMSFYRPLVSDIIASNEFIVSNSDMFFYCKNVMVNLCSQNFFKLVSGKKLNQLDNQITHLFQKNDSFSAYLVSSMPITDGYLKVKGGARKTSSHLLYAPHHTRVPTWARLLGGHRQMSVKSQR